MILAHSGTCTMHCSLLTDIRIARDTGYDAIELIESKLTRHIEQGFTAEDLSANLEGLPLIPARSLSGQRHALEKSQPVCLGRIDPLVAATNGHSAGNDVEETTASRVTS